MNDTWLVVEGTFLCHRAFWAIGELSYKDNPTGVAFGFLSDVLRMQERFGAPYVVLAFDLGESKRQKIFPEYKANRHQFSSKATPEEIEKDKENRVQLHLQIRQLWRNTLPGLGYDNVLTCQGIEADDWIAQACQEIQRDFPRDECVIVTADHDLFQCISPSVRMFNPNQKKVHTYQSFFQRWGLYPKDWPRVKAIAGCSSDNIPGVPGIGEILAAKYLTGNLLSGKRLEAIQNHTNVITQNVELVTLPIQGTPECGIIKRTPKPEAWKREMKKLGMKSLSHLDPSGRRRWRIRK